MADRNLLLRLLREGRLPVDEREWDVLIRQARSARLLAHLSGRILGSEAEASLPAGALRQLLSGQSQSRHQAEAVRNEIEQIRRALHSVGIPVVLLKGAAYVALGLPASNGRLMSDIDILVPKARLPDVEAALMRHGWISSHLDAYDQRYYRRWMHELPPMQHLKRGTSIDVHHAVLPETARMHADSERLRSAAVPVAGRDGIFTFAPEDLVLHSATHLFNEGELDSGLRDLVDLDSLFRHYGGDQSFWSRLCARAEEVGLQRPLYYALHYARRVLSSRIPELVEPYMERWAPRWPPMWFMDGLFGRALAPNHHTADDRLASTARWLLYVRGHWLRMPLHLLALHLTRKALRRPGEDVETNPVQR